MIILLDFLFCFLDIDFFFFDIDFCVFIYVFYVQGFPRCLIILDCLHIFKSEKLKLWLEAPNIWVGLGDFKFCWGMSYLIPL